jgi:hypothetical protein
MEAWRGRVLRVASVLFAGWLSGCAYHGNSAAGIDNPVSQSLTWFSFLDGHDIRKACAALGPKAPDHYRLVYNGQYTEQLRVYEIFGSSSGGATLTAKVKGHADLTNWVIKGPEDIFAPWSWQQSETALSAQELEQFREFLARSGFGSGAPQGLILDSNDFYWVASGCHQGQFHFYAWVAQKGAFADLPFQDFLLRHDGTGVPVRPPHVLTAMDRLNVGTRKTHFQGGDFTLQVRGEGFGGLINAF